MTRHARQRLRITLLVIFCLLFQQAALAGYACPLEAMPAETAGMARDCAHAQPATDSAALCDKHCNQDLPIAKKPGGWSVPLLALPTARCMAVLAPAGPWAGFRVEASAQGTDPPPRLRFCSLQI